MSANVRRQNVQKELKGVNLHVSREDDHAVVVRVEFTVASAKEWSLYLCMLAHELVSPTNQEYLPYRSVRRIASATLKGSTTWLNGRGTVHTSRSHALNSRAGWYSSWSLSETVWRPSTISTFRRLRLRVPAESCSWCCRSTRRKTICGSWEPVLDWKVSAQSRLTGLAATGRPYVPCEEHP